MADFCTIMTVVPTGGMDWSPPLGSGATDLWGLAFFFDPLLVAVAAAVADDAGADDGTVPDAALLASGALDGEPAAEFDDPPHAASSSTSDPIPVAAAHPLLRIFSPIRKDDTKRSRAVMTPGPGMLEPPADGQPAPPTMLLSDILTTCHTPPMPLPLVASAFAPL